MAWALRFGRGRGGLRKLGRFLELHIFMDMEFSSFCLSAKIGSRCQIKKSDTIYKVYIIITFYLWCSNIIFMTIKFPGLQIPVFCPVVRFFKKYIFGIYMLWGVSGCKNFTGQILSGIRFCPKLIIFRHFS